MFMNYTLTQVYFILFINQMQRTCFQHSSLLNTRLETCQQALLAELKKSRSIVGKAYINLQLCMDTSSDFVSCNLTIIQRIFR